MGTIYRNGVPYGGQAPGGVQFIGTKAEWDILSEEKKNQYINHEVIFKDEDNKSVNIYTVNGELVNVGGQDIIAFNSYEEWLAAKDAGELDPNKYYSYPELEVSAPTYQTKMLAEFEDGTTKEYILFCKEV